MCERYMELVESIIEDLFYPRGIIDICKILKDNGNEEQKLSFIFFFPFRVSPGVTNCLNFTLCFPYIVFLQYVLIYVIIVMMNMLDY